MNLLFRKNELIVSLISRAILPDSAVLATFRKRWQVANEEVLSTIPVGEPQRQIDYILYRPADRWKMIEARVLDEPVASDYHRHHHHHNRYQPPHPTFTTQLTRR